MHNVFNWYPQMVQVCTHNYQNSLMANEACVSNKFSVKINPILIGLFKLKKCIRSKFDQKSKYCQRSCHRKTPPYIMSYRGKNNLFI